MAEGESVPPVDEMVDGRGGVRPHWRTLLGILGGMGEGVLGERARRLDRAFEDEGMAGVLPGSKREVAWRCDPLPLVLSAQEFAALEAGIAQRARMIEALLRDLYGPQALLTEGLVPPELVFANRAFLRACHSEGVAPAVPQLHLYAVDLMRGPDGQWRVLADRTTAPAGAGLARENRRILARVMPEAFRGASVRSMRPFFDVWQDALQRLAPSDRPDPAVALLTRGTHHPRWVEDMLLSRELSCALVECGDLTVRGGAVHLKTLQGLQPVDVLLSRLEGAMLDPLESADAGTSGVPGLLDAARHGQVRILNAPGAALAEAPAFAAFLPALMQRLLGEAPLLPSVETLWLGDPAARARVLAEPGWTVCAATDGAARREVPREAWDVARNAEARPRAHAATRLPVPSVVPTVVGDRLEPRPLVLRMFAVFDGAEWRVMPGGLARIGADAALGGALPTQGLSKDVWVLAEEGHDIIGPAALQLPPLPIRRQPGALPSRVADNLFWLGRYTERLERAARLVRATHARISRGVVLPREAAEVAALARCLGQAGFTGAEEVAGSSAAQALPGIIAREMRPDGALPMLADRIATLTAMVRDRLTADMHATFTLTLRSARAELQQAGDSLEAIARAMIPVLRFATAVAGVAAESMVRGGAWLFLDLGRRIERAQAIASEVGFALEQPPARIEGGLRLILELCDSVITYRSRYLSILQPAPALDLVLADESNPRALAFQLAAISRNLSEVAGEADRALPDEAASLLAEAEAMVAHVLAAPDQTFAAAGLPPRLEAVGNRIAALSDAVTRRYFALLPARQTVGMEGAAPALKGAA
ncbi:circularly permuted type 2 ATP-grasp protein [Neoroseomonas oryzicola]|uniref:Circularly permuted type 2 ATP-grasp protein n=1 Tax=Neoroseomonas oryzicola TaxID=535904 RepID=A0A9X9WH04_9PROT|nr:circularly permuted type 2 ATP-grasp protein [Neoroseomonas oryzicola]MBR0659614.1 circularly permuted type 2 ATP-grasp protein [Neoroseomonas oryzicola]